MDMIRIDWDKVATTTKTDYIDEHCQQVSCSECVIRDKCDAIGGKFEKYPDVLDAGCKAIEDFRLANAIVPVVVEASNVDHPKHYNQGGIECIDAMVAAFGKEAVENFCLLNAFKYVWRSRDKNGVEDVNKAIWYLNKFKELGDLEQRH